MALDRSGLLDVLDALKVADIGDRVRQAAETVYQALIEASSPTRSAPRCTSARSRASTCVTVTAPASCPPRRGIGPRAARPTRPAPGPARRTTSTVPPAWVAPHPLAGLLDPWRRRGQQGSGPGAASPAPARATGPALEVGLPLRYNELVSNRGPVRRGVVRPGAVRGLPPAYLFVPLAEQLENVLRWNEDRQWGFAEAELDAIDLTPRTHPDPLVVDLLAVFLDAEYRGEDEGEMDGVRRTCHEMWSVAAERQLNTWCWDWIRDAYESRPKPVRLLPGVEHRPGVRRVTVSYMAGVVEAVTAVATRFAPRTARRAGLRRHDPSTDRQLQRWRHVTTDRGACDYGLPDPSRR
jgi:hypothetical protein